MVITFPQMGNITLAAKAFFEDTGIPCVPPENNRTALAAGAQVSPDEMCLPFKLMMGNYAAAVARGADTILITGSCGPCRFGEYCELQMRALEKQGSRIQFIVADAPGEVGLSALLERLGCIRRAGTLSAPRTLLALRRALHVLRLADALDAEAHRQAGREAERGACRRLLADCRRAAASCRGTAQTAQALATFLSRLRALPADASRRPLRVALVGEIYSMIEPFANLYIEETLMDAGVATARLLTPSWWLRDLALKPLGMNARAERGAARPYLPCAIGGHAQETVGFAELCARRGFDGAIQIFPSGCMPEIVAACALPEVSRRGDFPVLKLVFDEAAAEAGYATRIEAFLDMLEARRKRRPA